MTSYLVVRATRDCKYIEIKQLVQMFQSKELADRFVEIQEVIDLTLPDDEQTDDFLMVMTEKELAEHLE